MHHLLLLFFLVGGRLGPVASYLGVVASTPMLVLIELVEDRLAVGKVANGMPTLAVENGFFELVKVVP